MRTFTVTGQTPKQAKHKPVANNCNRKKEHVEISRTTDVEAKLSAGWVDIHLIHQCLPEIDRADIDLTANFCGRKVNYPLVISALTGGFPEAAEINRTLGKVARHFGLILEIGSQRPMLVQPEMAATYLAARKAAPDVLLVANIGAGQLISQKDSPALTLSQIKKLVAAIKADALAIHLNFLQESVMPEGDRHARGCMEAIGRVAQSLSIPVIVKETGAGISRTQALQLKSQGVAALEVGGAGGTSMALVESIRAASHNDQFFQRLGQTFGSWGLPTAVSIIEAKASQLPVIATGGIRSGLDAAKALALGADLVGMARPILIEVSSGGYQGTVKFLEGFFEELAIAMFLVGATNINELKQKSLVITGDTRDWLEQLGYDLPRLAECRV